MNLFKVKKIFPLLIVFILYSVCVYASGSEGGHGEGHGIDWMNFMWRTVNFTALVILLWYLLADKVKKYFIERKDQIAEELDDADKEKNNAEQQVDLYKLKFPQLDKEIQEIRDSLIGEIENEKNRIIEDAKVNAQRIIEQANASAILEVANARQELRSSVIELAGEMAVTIVNKNICEKDQDRLVEEYLTSVEGKN
jgi:F-type H+-transporting ATPase subunit b